jgi:hypothetical protein
MDEPCRRGVGFRPMLSWFEIMLVEQSEHDSAAGSLLPGQLRIYFIRNLASEAQCGGHKPLCFRPTSAAYLPQDQKGPLMKTAGLRSMK